MPLTLETDSAAQDERETRRITGFLRSQRDVIDLENEGSQFSDLAAGFKSLRRAHFKRLFRKYGIQFDESLPKEDFSKSGKPCLIDVAHRAWHAGEFGDTASFALSPDEQLAEMRSNMARMSERLENLTGKYSDALDENARLRAEIGPDVSPDDLDAMPWSKILGLAQKAGIAMKSRTQEAVRAELKERLDAGRRTE